MPHPIRFVVCTYNLWNDQRWPDRQEALGRFLERYAPDVLCVQELRPVTCEFIDAVLADTHQRVEDPFEGWRWEGNIFWSKQLFDPAGHGAEDIGILEELRRLFWVRLRFRDADKPGTLFVSTAHYTWPGHEVEKREQTNLRIPQARKTIEVLNALVPPEEPLLFMGDLNDSGHPIHILREGGLEDSFAALGRDTSPTWPALAIARDMPWLGEWIFHRGPVDWIFHRGPICPIASDVVDFQVGDVPPSDHKSLIATYTVLSGQRNAG